MEFHSDTKIMQEIFDGQGHDADNSRYKTQLKNNIQLVRSLIFDYEMRLKKILNSPTRMYYTELEGREQQSLDDIVDIYHYMKKKLEPSYPILINGIRREIHETLKQSNPDTDDYIIQDKLNRLRLMVSEIELLSTSIEAYTLFIFLILLSLFQYKILSEQHGVVIDQLYTPDVVEFPESMQSIFHDLKNNAIATTPHLVRDNNDYYSDKIAIYDFHQLKLIKYDRWYEIFGLEK